MKLAPAPNSNKANAVRKYKATLEGVRDNWSKSSLADSSMTSYAYGNDGFDSSQEECMRVVERQHRKDKANKKHYSSNSKSSAKSSEDSSSDTSSDEKTAIPVTCKYCKKYERKQHPKNITPETCMWNKKVKLYRFNSVCKKMNLKFINRSEFETGKEEQWPKHKQKEDKKDE